MREHGKWYMEGGGGNVDVFYKGQWYRQRLNIVGTAKKKPNAY